jgi:hypothetical protein
MELKVRAMDGIEPKSKQEVEEQLLNKHEKDLQDGQNQNLHEDIQEQEQGDELQQKEIEEKDVLSYIEKRYGKQINSIEELTRKREEAEPLPEDVAAYFKYKKETGRGIDDFVKLSKDFNTMNEDTLLKEYLIVTEEGLDELDIQDLMEEYSYDEDLDDESTIKKAKIAKKKVIAKAKKYFTEQKETYKQPLESRGQAQSLEANEEFQAYKQYIESAKTQQEEAERKRQWFVKKTDDVFNDEFKGFEFSLDDKKLVFNPGSASELKKSQESPMNFIQKYLDDNGLMKDAVGYHRSLAVAMNPEKFAKFFYEQGKSEATDDVTRKIKNINMSERRAPEVISKNGFSVKALNPDSGKGLKIRSIKNKN